MDFQMTPKVSTDTGFGAVNNLGGATPMPQEIMRRIAMSRAALQQNPGLPTEAINKGMNDVSGMTPGARQALQALLARNLGQSSNPSADTRLQQAVDLAYGTK